MNENRYAALEEKAKAVLLNNRKFARKGGVKYGFTCPSPTMYHWQWLWDSCFHAIALRWVDPEFARGEIRSLMSGQWEDGRVPNMVHVGHNWRFDRIIHGTGRDTSGITQPPIIADAVLRIHEADPDEDFLKEMYGPLKKYYDWLRDARETSGDGLIAIFHPWESGIDNSPRWDDIFEIKNFSRKMFDITKGLIMFRFNFVRYDNRKMMKASPYFVKGIDMNSYYHENLKCMAKIAELLGRDDDAEDFAARAEKTKQAVIDQMWDPEKKYFGDLVGKKEKLSVVPTPFSFLPLWTGIATEEQGAAILDELLNPEKFWTPYPVATTAADYKAFDPDGYWRGTVWINSSWFMVEALSRAGRSKEANYLKEKTLEMVDAGGFREYYNPFTGEGLGAKSFAWSTLVIDLIHREF